MNKKSGYPPKRKWTAYFNTTILEHGNKQRRWVVSRGVTSPTDLTGMQQFRLFGGGNRCTFELGMTKRKAIQLADILNKEKF